MPILTVTLNVAVDKRYDVVEVAIGRVQRVSRVLASAGGKGLNVSRACLLAGERVVGTGFVAGFAGQFVTSQSAVIGVRDEFVRVAGETRTCINIIDDAGVSTEFLEPGVTVTPSDLTELFRRFAALLPEVDVVTLSGSAPGGCPPDVYVPLITATRNAGLPVILDTSGDLLGPGVKAGPTVAKPNREELAALVAAELDTTDAVLVAARELCRRGPEWVVVSLGADGAMAVNLDRAMWARPARVTAVNPVGCGDVLVAGLACGLAAGLDVDAALPRAVQLAAASAAHPQTGHFDVALADRIEVEQVVL